MPPAVKPRPFRASWEMRPYRTKQHWAYRIWYTETPNAARLCIYDSAVHVPRWLQKQDAWNAGFRHLTDAVENRRKMRTW